MSQHKKKDLKKFKRYNPFEIQLQNKLKTIKLFQEKKVQKRQFRIANAFDHRDMKESNHILELPALGMKLSLQISFSLLSLSMIWF